MDRLHREFPDTWATLTRLPLAEQRSAAVRAAQEALAANGLALQRVDGEGDLAVAVSDADETAWALQERVDAGAASSEDHEAAFRRARALHAALLATHGGSPTEAVYEALHALPGGDRPATAAVPMPRPPWTCRLRAAVRLGLGRGHLAALAVVAYERTPVGPYGEALLAEVRLPRRITVPWIVVDSAASRAAGRSHWGLPKELASLALAADASCAVVQEPGAAESALRLTARAAGPRVPVRATAVLQQPGWAPAQLRFRGRARLALVQARGGPSSGTGPGVLLDGELHLGAARP